ncbi:hypothetical protein OFS35_26845, partial [Escherichia coli]|nr:hypothetical protein [Escherichia coli]
AVSPLYFTDEQTETIKPALTCRGSPYSTIIFDIQTDPIYLSEYSLNIFSSCNMVSASAVGLNNLISARFLNVAVVSLW